MVFEKIKGLINANLKVAEDKISLQSRLVEDLGADSANVMVLVMELEDNFGIMVEDDAILTFKTVEDVVKYIEARV